MIKQLNKIQYLAWILVGIYLSISSYTFYIAHNDGLLSPMLLIIMIIVLCLNVLLSLWTVRTKISSSNFSFILIIMSFSWIITGFNNSMPNYVHRSMVLVISFFPPLFLHFIIQNISEVKYAKMKNSIFMLILSVFSMLREFTRFGILNIRSDIFFFSNLFLMLFFSYIIYRENKNQGTLKWKSKEVQLILITAFCSIAPFILFSLIPGLFFIGTFRYTWTLGFVLLLPLVMGYLLSKNNLILHRYWKISFLTSYFLIVLVLGLIWWTLYVSFNPTMIQLIRASHLLLILGYVVYIIALLYTQHRKKTVENELSTFQEERETLTFYQLKNKLLEWDFSQTSKYWKEKWNLAEVTLFKRVESESTILFASNDTKESRERHSKMDDIKATSNQEMSPYEIQVNRTSPFSKEERDEITLKLKEWLHSLVEKEKLLDLKYKIEDRSYTALEKSVYLREMKLADVYHDMISRYLHDDVQQYIYYMKQMIFLEKSVGTIRKRTESITKNMEQSIKLRTIEWMGYPTNGKEIDRLVYETSQALEEHLPSGIILDMDIEVDSFENDTRETKSLLYRAIKECMINTYKHAQAKNLFISMNKKQQQWYLSIEDDGVGWNGDLNSTTRFGLASLYRQVETLGGEVIIRTAKNKGFKIDIRVPELE